MSFHNYTSRFFTILFLTFVCIEIKPNLCLAEEKPKLKIGVIAPLSGGVAVWGNSVSAAMNLVNQELGEPVTLNIQDEETCLPTKALSAYNYLTSVEKVDVLVASCLEGATAIAPLARRDKLPFFISGRSSHEFQNRNPHALSWLALLDNEGLAVADLVRQRGFKSGVALVWNGYFGLQFAQGIESAFKTQKLAISFKSIEVDQGSAPSGGDIQRVLNNEPDVVFMMLSEPAAAFAVRQLRALRYQGTIVIQSSMLQTQNPNVRSAFEGVLQQKFNIDQKKFDELRLQIRKLIGEEVADDFIFSYDGFRILIEKANQCREQKSANFEDCIQKSMRDEVWHQGASGRFRFLHDGSTERPMLFKRVTKSGYEAID